MRVVAPSALSKKTGHESGLTLETQTWAQGGQLDWFFEVNWSEVSS